MLLRQRLADYRLKTGGHPLAHDREPTVFLIDDDPVVRQSMSALTRSLKMPLEILVSADDFLNVFHPLQPGCLVAEVRLPGMSGLDLLEKLHRDGVFLASILVSSHAEVSTAVRAMRAGAITFLEKPLVGNQLWDALTEALHRDTEHRRQQTQIERIRRKMEKLNEGESEVLHLLLSGKLNREIAESLGISVRTVEVRRAKLMEKMKAATLPEMLRDVILLEFSSEKKFH
jgi:RNA polymerase sigma factor (sigma-70 family)